MGRRRNRKRKRNQERPSWLADTPVAPSLLDDDDEGDLWGRLPLIQGRPPRTVPLCGNCREFVEDGDFGRGTCLHLASGVLSPWHDTPACEFHQRI